MAVGYRLATDVPWDADWKVPDWGDPFRQPRDVVNVMMERAEKHRGSGFKLRERGEGEWSPTRPYRELEQRTLARITDDSFHVGDVLKVRSLDDEVGWLIREVDMPKVEMETVGDDDVDFNHGLVFRNPRFDDVESWGIRNDRYIGGTTQPSYHWARTGGTDPGCTARAEDFGGVSATKLREVGNAIANGGHCGKMLLAGHEWLPGRGWFYVGSYIGHYDHLHAESRDGSGSLC